MFGDIKQVNGVTFSKVGVLVKIDDMGLNKKRETDPDYYKVIVDVGDDLIECSAWYGVGFKESFKDLKQALYKQYEFTFELAKGMTKTKFGSDLVYYKPKVIGVKPLGFKPIDNNSKEG